MFINPIEYHLKKSLVGNFFILRNSNFKKLLGAIPSSYGWKKYEEIFKLRDNLEGEFKCEVGNKQFKTERMLSYDSTLKIYKNGGTFLFEQFRLTPTSMRFKDIPRVNHRMLMNDKIITLDDIPKDIYEILIQKSDIHIINFSTR